MKKYKVRGYAHVPVLVEIVVEAESEGEAGEKSEEVFRTAQHRSRLIVPGTEDNAGVHSFRWSEVMPTALQPRRRNRYEKQKRHSPGVAL